MLKEIKVEITDGETSIDVETYIQTGAQDGVAESVQTIATCTMLLESLCDRITSELCGLTLTATDDNAKEIAESVRIKFAKVADNFMYALTETSNDWEDYSLLGIVDYFVDTDVDDASQTQTLVIPTLRKHLQAVVGDEFTEDMFESHLEHLRKQFNLGMSFK